MRSLALCLVTALLALGVSACGAAQPEVSTTTGAAAAAPSEEHGDHSGHSMATDSEVPFDALFIDGMIEHHQGAVEMAEIAIAQAEHEEIRLFAEGIIAAQDEEIEQMQAWRAAWFPDLEPTAGMAMDMGQMSIPDDESIPFDQRFLEAMISHHEGAIQMAEMALEMSEREEILTLAQAIIAAQTAEIEQMQLWLAEWYSVAALDAVTTSPYAVQLASPVRGLTAQEVDDLLAGRGMGYARMAELNNHPGPRHLLDLNAELALTPAQITQVEATFAQMEANAQALGAEIVAREQALSEAFAAGTLDAATLDAQVAALADLYGELRGVHLQAHLTVTPLLTGAQVAQYNTLRGYADPDASHPAH